MTKTDFIKVSGFGNSKVILAANASFYREHKYQIEEPTDEEIKAEFPEYQIADPEESEEPTDEAPKAKRTYTRRATN